MSSIGKMNFFVTALAVALLASCSSGSVDPSQIDTQSFEDFVPVINSGVLLDLPTDTPDPGASLTVKTTDPEITLVFATQAARQKVGVDYIASQWSLMMSCLNTTSLAPVIFIEDGWIDVGDVDDVLFSIEGRRIATSTIHSDGSRSVQISTYDFDGSQGNPGFHLRSILGRFLWTVNDLPVRDYNTACASG